MLHHVQSVTKSITSACIGIAIDKGFIKSVKQSIFDYLPEYQHLKKDGREKITIEHLLTMTMGCDVNEWNMSYGDKNNPIIGIWFSEKDPLTYILDRPWRYEPGTHYSYYGGSQIILGEIVRQAAGMNIKEFSGKYLFGPLGITSFDWAMRFPDGVFEAAGGLKLTPRGMVKIGVTFLHKGKWKGKQVVSSRWVDKCAVSYPGNEKIYVPGENYGKVGYSYSWWTKEYSLPGGKTNMFYALGWGGQYIMVFPELHMVVVLTGGNFLAYKPLFELLEKHIFPAVG
jgi:CubicO group peptidase (beta-lactamase class C family)